MALGTGDIFAIVLGIYALVVTVVCVGLVWYVLKKRRAKKATPVPAPRSSNPGFNSQDGDSSRRSSRGDPEAQRRQRTEEVAPPIGYVKVELRKEQAQRQAPLPEEMPSVKRGHKRQDSIDALSFGTVLSSDSSDDENAGKKFHNKKPAHEDQIQVHDFSSVKSDTDSADTLYDDVVINTPRIGVRSPNRQRQPGRPSVSSTLSNEFFDAIGFEIDIGESKTDNEYLNIPPNLNRSLEESGNDVMYDDVIVNNDLPAFKKLAATSVQRSRKKAPPPSLPQIPQQHSTNNKVTKSSSSSSSSSSEESPQLRKKEYLNKDREEARRSYQQAPEQYRKESSYLDVNTENGPTKQNIDTIHQDLSAKLSLKSAASTISISSSTSSKESVIHNYSNVMPISPSVEQISPKFEQISPHFEIEMQKCSNDIKKVIGQKDRKNSTSSSSSSDSNKSENMSEDSPKYLPRKSSFSSPSELEPDWKIIHNFGKEPEECVIYDEAKVSKKIPTQLSESSGSDSDTSASEIDHSNTAIKLNGEKSLPKENRIETIESSDLSDNRPNKPFQRQASTSSSSEDDQQLEKIPGRFVVHPALQLQPTEESNSPDIRRNSTSSESSTNENVEQTKRPILFRHDNVDVSMNRGNSIKKIVRIHEPVSSDSSETEYSSEAEVEEYRLPMPNVRQPELKMSEKISITSSESSSESESSEEKEKADSLDTNSIPYENILQNENLSTGSSVENSVDDIDYEPQTISFATEVIVQDDNPVKQCQPVSVSSTSSSSDSSDDDEPIYEVVKTRPRVTSPVPTINHANTLPVTNKQIANKRRDSSSSSSSSSSPSSPKTVKRAQTLPDTSLNSTFLQNINRNYQPVYKLRKVNSMTQTDYKEPTETAA